MSKILKLYAMLYEQQKGRKVLLFEEKHILININRAKGVVLYAKSPVSFFQI